CLRTVKVSRAPWPWRLITTPSKTCTRRRVPSITWKWTFTRSPGAKLGTRRSWARSIVWMTLLIREGRVRLPAGPDCAVVMVAKGPSGRRRSAAAPARPAAFAAALAAPALDPLVMTGEQNLGDLPAPVGGGTRVVRVLGVAFERLAEGLLRGRALVAEGTRQLARDRVADHHRGRLAAAQHVAADRHRVAREVLDDALVEALVAPAEQRQARLGGQLVDERLVQQAPSRRERDHPAARTQLGRVDAVAGAQRGVEHIHPQHHPCAAAEGRVVDLPAGER